MMEKMNTTYQGFQKKIIPYLDGSLSQEDLREFEAFVSTHPEFEAQIKVKQNEIDLIKNMIPSVEMSSETSALLDMELRSSIYNLVKEDSKNVLDSIRIKFEEWSNR